MVVLTAATNGSVVLTNGTEYTQFGRFEPSKVPDYATSITFRDYELHTLPANLFLNFTKWTSLTFYHMGISQIEEGAWNGLENLVTLDLAQNKLTALYTGMFMNLGLLSELTLSWNQISVIEDGAFNGLKLLKHLKLARNDIRIEDLHIKNLNETLELLYLGYNRITHIPAGFFENFLVFHTLHLRNTSISVLSPNAFKGLPLLRNLDLSFNNLKTLQRNIFDSGHPGILHSVW